MTQPNAALQRLLDNFGPKTGVPSPGYFNLIAALNASPVLTRTEY